MLSNIPHRILARLGDNAFNFTIYSYLHLKNTGKLRLLNFGNPKTFNEKIIWLKTHFRVPDAHIYADKVAVKSKLLEFIPAESIIPTIGTWKSANEIDFDRLPDEFIIKANHGSGWNLLVPDKKSLDIASARRKLTRWLRTNYFSIGREYQYKDIEPALIAEPLIRPTDGSQLLDYKFFCFNGKPQFIQVDRDRHTEHRRNFYDLNWNRLPYGIMYKTFTPDCPPPRNLNRMIDIARRLSRDLPFVRVDLYDCIDQVYFGELTFHPGGGFEPFSPESADLAVGNYLQLPL
jgi:hypothetical protein